MYVKLFSSLPLCLSVSVSVSLSLCLSLIICPSRWLAVTLSLCLSIRPVAEWGLSAGLMIKLSRTRLPTEAGDSRRNLFNRERDFIAYCFPLSPFRRPDETEII